VSAGVSTHPAPVSPPGPFQIGRSFVHPVFDYLLIGGGLSLVVGLLVGLGGDPVARSRPLLVATFLLFVNSAHFAASTVRLYTKPGAFGEWPFLALGLPLAMIALLTVALLYGEHLGRHLFALYLTWSPFHYAAQAFGLASMYSYRSGCRLSEGDRRLLWWCCMLPFAYSFVGGYAAGLGWFVPPEVFSRHPTLTLIQDGLSAALILATFMAPLVLLARLERRGEAFPLISLLAVFTNGIWWILFDYFDAFLWATVFHGLQYLSIVTIFHVRDQRSQSRDRHGWAYHALWFYGTSLVLGYLLFQVWPFAYVSAGFRWSESALLVVATINIHHFIVDRYIWRLRKDPNYRIVVSGG